MSDGRSLLPREHGAYAELAFPLVTGLALAPPTLPAMALALSASAFFLAHEPMAILFGVRGDRLRVVEGGRSRGRVIGLLAFGSILGGLGAIAAGAHIWPELLIPTVPLLLLAPLMVLGRQKTLVGELLVVTVFATLVFPVGGASMADLGRITSAATVWWISFTLGTIEVHAIKARHKGTKRSRWTLWGSPLISGTAVLVSLGVSVFGGDPYRLPAMALLPPALSVLALALLRVHPRRLKRVGWTLVGANTIALVILLASG